VTDGTNPIQNVTMTLTSGGITKWTTLTAANGTYSFAAVGGDSDFVLTPTKTGFTFTPPSNTYNNIISNQNNQNYTGTINKYTISGVIDTSGVDLTGVTVTLSDGKDSVLTTIAGGAYQFTVNATGNYTVTPSKTGFTFVPVNQTFNNVTSNQTQNFTGTRDSYTISGTVSNSGPSPISGITVRLRQGGVEQANTITASNGTYSFTGLYNGTFTVAPDSISNNYHFTPDTITVIVNYGSQLNQNFVAKKILLISGHITGKIGGGNLANITVDLTGSSSGTVNTDAGGLYSFNVDSAGSYTVTPVKINYAFTPVNRTVANIIGDSTTWNFLGSRGYTISGTINGKVGGGAMSGITVNLTGTTTGSTVTNGSGQYTFTVDSAGNYTVIPVKTNYVFLPDSHTVTGIIGDSTWNFQGNRLFTVSGNITGKVGGAPMPGLKVYLSGSITDSIVTDGAGHYTFSVDSAGSYTVTPVKTNYAFTPVNRTVASIIGDSTGWHFEGGRGYVISGTITAKHGGGVLPGVTVTLTGTTTGATVTNGAGFYTFSVDSAGNYTITPTKTNYTFTPVNRIATGITGDSTTWHFIGNRMFALTGNVSISGGAAVVGVKVKITGSALDSAITDASGNYIINFDSLSVPNAYNIKPTLAGYSFIPTDTTFNNINTNISKNFIAVTDAPAISFTSTQIHLVM
jgi:hypothetical protein